MIFYFIGTLLFSFALIKLGSYAAIIAMITNGTKVVVALMLVMAIVLLYRRFKGIHKSKPQALTHKT